MTFLKALLLAIVFAVPMVWAEAQMRPPVPLTSRQFADAPPGQPVKLAVRVESAGASSLRGEVLTRRSDSRYARTGSQIELSYDARVPIVMGSPGDLTPGAVLFVDAVAAARGRAEVRRFVVVTKYVTLESAKS